MSNINIVDRVPSEYNRQNEITARLAIQNQLNNLSSGVLAAVTNATTAAPSGGTYAVGDFVRNSTPTELGSAGSKFVIYGWLCSATPNTFLQCRFLTGN